MPKSQISRKGFERIGSPNSDSCILSCSVPAPHVSPFLNTVNPESSDPPTAILCAQTLKEFTIISSVFVRHAYQLISMYKMNFRTDMFFFFWGGGGLTGEGRLSQNSYFLEGAYQRVGAN